MTSGQLLHRFDEVRPHRAANASVERLDDLLIRHIFCILCHQAVVDPNLTKFILYDSNPLAVRSGQYVIEKRRFSCAEKAGENGDRNEIILLRCVVEEIIVGRIV